MELLLKIAGMKCEKCRKKVEDAIMSVPGVDSAAVSLNENSAVVNGSMDRRLLERAVISAGFDIAD